jgi:hypothetical protein
LKVQTYHNISAPTGCLVNSCKFAGKKPTWNLIVRLGLLQFAQHNIVGLGLTNFYEGFTNLYIINISTINLTLTICIIP